MSIQKLNYREKRGKSLKKNLVFIFRETLKALMQFQSTSHPALPLVKVKK